MRDVRHVFSNTAFDVWLDPQGDLSIEFGMEYSCDTESLLALMSFLVQRGFVVKEGDTFRLSPSGEGHIASLEIAR